jgi:hypothetical protein
MSDSKLESATLHRTVTLDALRILGTRCKNLESIEILSGASTVGESLIDAAMYARNLKSVKLGGALEISLTSVCELLKRRPTLASIEFDAVDCNGGLAEWKEDLPSLRRLHLVCRERPLPTQALSETLNLVSANAILWYS